MGKVNRRQPLRNSNHHDNPHRAKKTVVRRQHSQHDSRNAKSKLNGKRSQSRSTTQASNNSHSANSKVPFSQWDQILLVGEGDFSFASSLSTNYDVSKIVATCFDSKDVLLQKYPDVTRILRKLCDDETELVEATKDSDTNGGNVTASEDEWNGFSSPERSEDEDSEHSSSNPSMSTNVIVHYGIDATKLSTTHRKILKRHSPFTRIVFNFPHVGGLSTDVNRQVRSNQELLVNFFNSAKSLLATKTNPAAPPQFDEEADLEEYDSDTEHKREQYLKHGQILVTLFEGEPYTLWNIRDLARHSGLKVLESFKFPWSAYPKYRHARTIGDITTGKDRSEDGKRKGAWRGEERDARCYILALKDDDGRPGPGSRKRKKQDDSD